LCQHRSDSQGDLLQDFSGQRAGGHRRHIFGKVLQAGGADNHTVMQRI
jgi:hypothetical protein